MYKIYITIKNMPRAEDRRAVTIGNEPVVGSGGSTADFPLGSAEDLDDIPDGVTRFALTDGTQQIEGEKTFVDVTTFDQDVNFASGVASFQEAPVFNTGGAEDDVWVNTDGGGTGEWRALDVPQTLDDLGDGDDRFALTADAQTFDGEKTFSENVTIGIGDGAARDFLLQFQGDATANDTGVWFRTDGDARFRVSHNMPLDRLEIASFDSGNPSIYLNRGAQDESDRSDRTINMLANGDLVMNLYQSEDVGEGRPAANRGLLLNGGNVGEAQIKLRGADDAASRLLFNALDTDPVEVESTQFEIVSEGLTADTLKIKPDDAEGMTMNNAGKVTFATGPNLGTDVTPAIGDVWTATDTAGNGQWAATAPTVTNLDDVPDSATRFALTASTDLDDIQDSTSRFALTNTTQSITGVKTFSEDVTIGTGTGAGRDFLLRFAGDATAGFDTGIRFLDGGTSKFRIAHNLPENRLEIGGFNEGNPLIYLNRGLPDLADYSDRTIEVLASGDMFVSLYQSGDAADSRPDANRALVIDGNSVGEAQLEMNRPTGTNGRINFTIGSSRLSEFEIVNTDENDLKIKPDDVEGMTMDDAGKVTFATGPNLGTDVTPAIGDVWAATDTAGNGEWTTLNIASNLDELIDGSSRFALTAAAQTINGEKQFVDNMRIGNNSLDARLEIHRQSGNPGAIDFTLGSSRLKQFEIVNSIGNGDTLDIKPDDADGMQMDATGKVTFATGPNLGTDVTPAIGDVWTATDTAGNGEWSTPAGGGVSLSDANTWTANQTFKTPGGTTFAIENDLSGEDSTLLIGTSNGGNKSITFNGGESTDSTIDFYEGGLRARILHDGSENTFSIAASSDTSLEQDFTINASSRKMFFNSQNGVFFKTNSNTTAKVVIGEDTANDNHKYELAIQPSAGYKGALQFYQDSIANSAHLQFEISNSATNGDLNIGPPTVPNSIAMRNNGKVTFNGNVAFESTVDVGGGTTCDYFKAVLGNITGTSANGTIDVATASMGRLEVNPASGGTRIYRVNYTGGSEDDIVMVTHEYSSKMDLYDIVGRKSDNGGTVFGSYFQIVIKDRDTGGSSSAAFFVNFKIFRASSNNLGTNNSTGWTTPAAGS